MILPARQKAIRAKGVGGSGVEVRVGRGAISGRWFILWWARKWVGWRVGGRMGGSQLKWVTKMDGGSLSIKKVFVFFQIQIVLIRSSDPMIGYTDPVII